ncbi:MAG: type II toxin-antitoxin system MqsA family antitoxin [Burkholderiales bacterium]|nr:type II toxin-antitoxin system MqsA family antitoxin [Anaerolineae bacterium]
MKCVVCKQGETLSGTTTLTFERDNMTLVVKGVPAQVCENCGEAYIDDAIAVELLQMATDALENGVQVDVREYMRVGA